MQKTSCRCKATSYPSTAQVQYKLTQVFLSATARHSRQTKKAWYEEAVVNKNKNKIDRNLATQIFGMKKSESH